MKLEQDKRGAVGVERHSMMGVRGHSHLPFWSTPLNALVRFPGLSLRLVAAAALLASAASSASAGPNDLKAVAPRPERAVDDARLTRMDDAFGDVVERARKVHDELAALDGNKGKKAVELVETLQATKLERSTDAKGDEREKTARADAHLARVRDGKGDREERAALEAERLGQAMQQIANGQFRKNTADFVKTHVNPEGENRRQQQEEQKQNEKRDSRELNRDEKERERQLERTDDRSDRALDRADRALDRAQDRKADRAENVKEAKDEKAKERADDRKERRDDIQQERNDERTAAKPGAGAAASGP